MRKSIVSCGAACLSGMLLLTMLSGDRGVVHSAGVQQEEGAGIVKTDASKWAIVPELAAPPALDGKLNEAQWQNAAELDDFRTVYWNETPPDSPQYRIGYDATHLYIGGHFSAEEAASLARIELLVNVPDDPEKYYVAQIPVDPATTLTSVTNWDRDWRPGVERQRVPVSASGYGLQQDASTQQWELELALPWTAIGDGLPPQTGDRWKLNVVHVHNINMRPMLSWMPIRYAMVEQSSLVTSSGPVIVSANAVDHASWGNLYFGGLPAGEAWVPEALEMSYTGFTQKRLRLSGLDAVPVSIQGLWEAPDGSEQLLPAPAMTEEAGELMLELTHPEPLADGLYRLQLTFGMGAGAPDKVAILAFDREGLIQAGLDRVGRVFPTVTSPAPVQPEPPSAAVQQWLDLIPDQFGVPHIGVPGQSHLRPQFSMFRLTSDLQKIEVIATGETFPSAQYPETHVLTALNRKGETVEYPYYEDAEGKRYFFSAALWNHQTRKAREETAALAASDPLGAARLLLRFAEVSEGYVPRTNNEWNTYPVNQASGPPYNFRSGYWSVWKPEELSHFDLFLNTYEKVMATNALDVLSQELGRDVDQQIRTWLFQPAVDYVFSMPNLMHNTDPYMWQRLIRMANVLDEPDYTHRVLEWIDQFVSSQFLADGFWKEITPAYHAQVVNNMVQAIGGLQGYTDPPGYVSPRTGKRYDQLDVQQLYPQLASAQQIPNLLAYPNGKQVPIQDTWASTNRTADPQAKSMVLPSSGIGRLTLGQGTAQSQLYLMYTPKYGHNQFDPLNLTLFAEGQELLPDIGYTYSKYRQFANSTIGHNTVVVDGSNMPVTAASRHGGRVEQAVTGGGLFQALRASYPGAYAQTSEYSREPWLIPFAGDPGRGYVLDLFRVSGGGRHEYTFQGDANRDAYFASDMTMQDYGPYLLPEGTVVREPESYTDFGEAGGQYPGYQYVRDVQQAVLDDDRYDLTLVTMEGNGSEMAKLQITGLLEPGTHELYLGRSPSVRTTRLYGSGQAYDNNDEADKYDMPKLVLRREGTNLQSTFVTVMEPYRDSALPRIDFSERLQPDQAPAGAVAVQVTYGNTTDLVLSNPHHPELPVVVGDETLYGEMGLVRKIDGVVREMMLVGGTQLTAGTHMLTGSGSLSGIVQEVERPEEGTAGEHAWIVSETIDAAAVGQMMVVTHPDGSTSGYAVTAVEPLYGGTRVSIGQADPGLRLHSDGSSEQLFFPAKRWTGAHHYRIALIDRQSWPDGGQTGQKGTIAGTVVDAEQVPLAGAEVRVAGYSSLTALTDANGQFALHQVPLGRHRVLADKEGYNRVVSEPVDLTGQQSPAIQLTMQKRITVELSDVTETVAGLGDPVQATSSRDGQLHLVPLGTGPNRQMIESAASSAGRSQPASAGVPASFATAGLASGWYVVYAIDLEGRISEASRPVYLLDRQNPPQSMDDKDLVFFGSWDLFTSSVYAGGTGKRAGEAGAYVDVPFYGRAAKVFGNRTANGGIAEIYLDGELVAEIDTYSPAVQYQRELYHTPLLEEGIHVLRVVATGASNPLSGDIHVSFDILRVVEEGAVMPVLASVTAGPVVSGEEIEAVSRQSGQLFAVPAGTAAATSALNGAVTAGLGRSAVVTAHETVSLATYGLATGWYDLYVLGPAPVSELWAAGQIAVVEPTPVTIDDNDAIIRYTGQWIRLQAEGHWSGGTRYARVKGELAEIPFYGAGAVLLGHRNEAGGLAEVYIDGVYQETIDYYAPDIMRQQEVFRSAALPEGAHMLTLKVLSQRSSSANNVQVRLDALHAYGFAPQVRGIEPGGLYREGVVVAWSEPESYTARLNGLPVNSGHAVQADGEYALVIQDAAGNAKSYPFRIDQTAPTVTGVTYGGMYAQPIIIQLEDASSYTALLNDEPFVSGSMVSEAGAYLLVVRDAAGNETLIRFEITATPERSATPAEVVEQYAASEEIQSVLADQLRYRLQIIDILLAQQQVDTAVAYLRDLLRYAGDPSVQAQQLISAAAWEELQAAVEAWMVELAE